MNIRIELTNVTGVNIAKEIKKHKRHCEERDLCQLCPFEYLDMCNDLFKCFNIVINEESKKIILINKEKIRG